MEERDDIPTQAEITSRETEGIMKAMTSVQVELANELAKLNENDKEMAKEKEKTHTN